MSVLNEIGAWLWLILAMLTLGVPTLLLARAQTAARETAELTSRTNVLLCELIEAVNRREYSGRTDEEKARRR